jgi:hypothetical protein
MPTNHGQATKTWIVPLLDRCEERIEVGVEDGRAAWHERLFAYRGSGRSRRR